MKTKHTPAPWCFHGAYSEIHTTTDEDGNQVIAEMNPDNDFTREENAANARLIAAAPELLAALQWFVECMHDDSVDDMGKFINEMEKRANEAIAKAAQ